MKKAIKNNIKSSDPDQDLLVFSNSAVVKSLLDDLKYQYQQGCFVHVTEGPQDLELTAGYIGRYARRPPLSEIRACTTGKAGGLKEYEPLKAVEKHEPPIGDC